MTEPKPFSIEQSEELIAQLKSETTSEFEQLRKTLQLLGQVPELSQGMVPPALPSTVNQAVVNIGRKASKSHRTIITSIISAGILVSATLTAAAVTGRGPSPIVSVAHSTVKFVKNVVGTVANVVEGNHSSEPVQPKRVTEQSQVPTQVPTTSPTPTVESNSNQTGNPEGNTTENKAPEGNTTENKAPEGNTTENKAPEGNTTENKAPESSSAPVIVQPEKPTKDKSHEGQTKVVVPSLPTTAGENGDDGQSIEGENTPLTPTPGATPTPAGEVAQPPQGIPTPAPTISAPTDDSGSEGSD